MHLTKLLMRKTAFHLYFKSHLYLCWKWPDCCCYTERTTWTQHEDILVKHKPETCQLDSLLLLSLLWLICVYIYPIMYGLSTAITIQTGPPNINKFKSNIKTPHRKVSLPSCWFLTGSLDLWGLVFYKGLTFTGSGGIFTLHVNNSQPTNSACKEFKNGPNNEMTAAVSEFFKRVFGHTKKIKYQQQEKTRVCILFSSTCVAKQDQNRRFPKSRQAPTELRMRGRRSKISCGLVQLSGIWPPSHWGVFHQQKQWLEHTDPKNRERKTFIFSLLDKAPTHFLFTLRLKTNRSLFPSASCVNKWENDSCKGKSSAVWEKTYFFSGLEFGEIRSKPNLMNLVSLAWWKIFCLNPLINICKAHELTEWIAETKWRFHIYVLVLVKINEIMWRALEAAFIWILGSFELFLVPVRFVNVTATSGEVVDSNQGCPLASPSPEP